MPVQDNKQAVRRFYDDVVNGRNLDAVDELLTPDGVDHTFGSQSAEQAKQFFGMIQQAFPDMRVEVHDVIAEGELVAARVTYTGTHQGEFVGIPATGKQTMVNGVDFFRMQDGKQAEHWGGPDMFGFLTQLGVMPGPARRDRARPPNGREWGTAAPSSVGRQRSGATAVAWLWSSRGPAHHA